MAVFLRAADSMPKAAMSFSPAMFMLLLVKTRQKVQESLRLNGFYVIVVI
jgi:hypothetical protein